jgi:hypothetical protein
MSFTDITVNANDVVDVRLPSVTEIVIVTIPDSFAVGVIVKLLDDPVPLISIFSMATRVIFDELEETVKLEASDSASVTVKLMALVAVSSYIL